MKTIAKHTYVELQIADDLDKFDELEVIILQPENDAGIWLSKQEVIQLLEHLKQVLEK
jgi:hypothetical protein